MHGISYRPTDLSLQKEFSKQIGFEDFHNFIWTRLSRSSGSWITPWWSMNFLILNSKLSQFVNQLDCFHENKYILKSVHFKKTVARFSFLSKLWYVLFNTNQKVPQFWKKRKSRNCLLKMNRLYSFRFVYLSEFVKPF